MIIILHRWAITSVDLARLPGFSLLPFWALHHSGFASVSRWHRFTTSVDLASFLSIRHDRFWHYRFHFWDLGFVSTALGGSLTVTSLTFPFPFPPSTPPFGSSEGPPGPSLHTFGSLGSYGRLRLLGPHFIVSPRQHTRLRAKGIMKTHPKPSLAPQGTGHTSVFCYLNASGFRHQNGTGRQHEECSLVFCIHPWIRGHGRTSWPLLGLSPGFTVTVFWGSTWATPSSFSGAMVCLVIKRGLPSS